MKLEKFWKFVDEIGDRMLEAYKKQAGLFIAQWIGILLCLFILALQCRKVLGDYAFLFPGMHIGTIAFLHSSFNKTGTNDESDNDNWPSDLT